MRKLALIGLFLFGAVSLAQLPPPPRIESIDYDEAYNLIITANNGDLIALGHCWTKTDPTKQYKVLMGLNSNEGGKYLDMYVLGTNDTAKTIPFNAPVWNEQHFIVTVPVGSDFHKDITKYHGCDITASYVSFTIDAEGTYKSIYLGADRSKLYAPPPR